MGVAGLWEVLRPAGQVRSLTELAVQDGFNANPSNQRGFRIGIDASIWFFHAAYGKEGENPELRTLFFRCCRLLQSPLLPLFVFDGPNRPAVKRGKRIGGNAHWLTQGMKNIIDAFGFEWWVAPGEAEAELAYLNRVGIIDAILSDDVDNFLFGATMVIRNNNLSGNRANPIKNAQGRDDGNHVVTYTANAILSDPSVSLTRQGAILIGLLSGGDYIPAGLPGCGQKFSTGLARAGFGDSLMKAVKEFRGARLDAFLDQWRQDVRKELKTNKSGLLPSKKPSLAASLPDDFPSLPVIMSYVDPLTTENSPQKDSCKAPPGKWRNDPDPMKIASLCELYFEWGVKDVIVHRFRTVLWPGIVCRAVRRTIVDKDACRRPTPCNVHCHDSEVEDTVSPSVPTKQVASAISALTLSSPSKKSTTGKSNSNPSLSDFFTLSSLVPLICPSSPSSSPSTSATSSIFARPPLLLEVVSQRTHASTDSILEYRVLVDPTALVERAESGVKGIRPPLIGGLFGTDEDGDGDTLYQDENGGGDDIERLETAAVAASKSGKKKRKARREVPTTPLRLWLPACMVQAAAPALVQAYEETVKVREEKKAKRGTKAGRSARVGMGVKSTSRTKVKDAADGSDDESVPRTSTTKKVGVSKAKPRTVRAPGERRIPKRASKAQVDVHECINLSAGESLCSSDGQDVEENTRGRAKPKTTQTDIIKPAIKASTSTASTMKEFFNTTKPSIVKTTKSKPFTSRDAAKPSKLNPATSKRVCDSEEDESTDIDTPPLLAKSSRPLDVLRAKSRSGTIPTHPTPRSKLKPTVIPGHEGSPGSRPSHLLGPKTNASSFSVRSTQSVPQTGKRQSFVNVSDTDLEIEVSDVRRPSSGTAEIVVQNELNPAGVGVGNTLSTSKVHIAQGGVVDGVIDLIAKGDASRPKNAPLTLVPSTSLLFERSSACLAGAGGSSILGVDAAAIGPTSSQVPLKLSHILLSQSSSENVEKGKEGPELPRFHRGFTKPRTRTEPTVCRPAPRPFPMRFLPESPASPCAPNPKRTDESNHSDTDYGDDVVEIVDVFTSVRSTSPPRSPTPSPSPISDLPDHASARPATSAKPERSSGFSTSPTDYTSQTSTSPQKKTKAYCRTSSDWDTDSSGDKSGALKSPRKSAAHSSPRHVACERGRASSPTPHVSSHRVSRADDMTTGASAEKRGVLDYDLLQLYGAGSRSTVNAARLKPRLSDTSAIYISSGSEAEDSAQLSVKISRDDGEARMDKDTDEWTDQDVDEWVNTGMILSMPPSPCARPSPTEDPASSAPAVEMNPKPERASKFKPASFKVDAARAPSADLQTSSKTTSKNLKATAHDEIITLRPVHRAPLLAARAKQSKCRESDVIDLTSD